MVEGAPAGQKSENALFDIENEFQFQLTIVVFMPCQRQPATILVEAELRLTQQRCQLGRVQGCESKLPGQQQN
jgi:hypothetical protein